MDMKTWVGISTIASNFAAFAVFIADSVGAFRILYRPMLEPEISAQIIEANGERYVIAHAKLRNYGRSRVILEHSPQIKVSWYSADGKEHCAHPGETPCPDPINAFETALNARPHNPQESRAEAGEAIEHMCLSHVDRFPSAVAFGLRLHAPGHARLLGLTWRHRVRAAETVISAEPKTQEK